MIEGYRLLVRITEEEMWQLKNEHRGLSGTPVYYCVMGKDKAQFHPAFDPEKFSLMCKEGL